MASRFNGTISFIFKSMGYKKREREREREREKKREKITPTKWRLIYSPGNTGALQFEMQLYRPQEMLISQRGF